MDAMTVLLFLGQIRSGVGVRSSLSDPPVGSIKVAGRIFTALYYSADKSCWQCWKVSRSWKNADLKDTSRARLSKLGPDIMNTSLRLAI
jgi:hypothetical protein